MNRCVFCSFKQLEAVGNVSENLQQMRLDIVSDVVCPWCIVGFLQLQQAMREANITAEIHWQPFELNPAMVDDGENLDSHLEAKYSSTAEQRLQTREQLVSLGESLGFPFRFDDDMRIVNTFSAHQLLHWAAINGRQHELKITLFHCYFARGRDVSDHDVLANAAVEAGLDFEEASAILEDQRYATAVREAQRVSISGGIQGVPAVIINQRELLVGAQGVAQFKAALQQAVA